MNKYEWTKELDSYLMQSVVRNYFNFQIAASELNIESKNLGLDFGATNLFNHEKCRYRWSYLHLQRKLGKPIAYKSIMTSASESEKDKENNNSANRKVVAKSGPSNPKSLLDAKNFQNMTDKSEPKSFEEIEAEMWKNNIKKGKRLRKDFLDTASEDFSMNKTRGIDGKEVTPSSFNIFRDSLRKASEKMTDKLIENLPELDLKEIEDSESEAEDDVLPLDFRTAMIEKENKIVI